MSLNLQHNSNQNFKNKTYCFYRYHTYNLNWPAKRYELTLLDCVKKTHDLFPKDKAEDLSEDDMETIEKIVGHIKIIKKKVTEMVNARRVANKITNEREKAIAYHDTVVPPMDIIRYHIDKLELMVDNEIWPLPKYRELLFIR